ncbi:MAG: rhomboid family intramembrane serine protease [Armatimonadota bacterium]|nr:rhomboid family intramembrane serine protease [Armatimonadota bacterium]MCX7776654.1 rhomboid family intramembrane serine protease [Armatimonadota bacterium]MDW8025731.1 rhomboid family intramembrane serine protease [Armatimonadota bacterium]
MFLIAPIGTSAKLRRTPIITYLFIGINVLVYFLELVVYFTGYNNALQRLFYTLGFVPANPKWYALLTSIFVHDAPLPFHILGNMVYLWVFGRHIENVLGSAVYALFYTTSQLGAILMQVIALKLLDPKALLIPQVGASGAIAALLGLFAVRFYHERIELFYAYSVLLYFRYGTVQLPSLAVLSVWFALEILSGVLSHFSVGDTTVGHWAHVGGFLVGVVAAFSFGSLKEAQAESLTIHAEWLLRCGMFSAAVKYLKRAVRIDPANAFSRFLLSASLARVGDVNLAVAHLQAALRYGTRSSSSGSHALTELVSALPEEVWGELIQLSTPQMRLDMAVLFERACNYEIALRVFRSIVLDEHAEEELRALATIRSADILLKHYSDREGAAKMLKWLCERFPNSQWADLARHMLQRLGKA